MGVTVGVTENLKKEVKNGYNSRNFTEKNRH